MGQLTSANGRLKNTSFESKTVYTWFFGRIMRTRGNRFFPRQKRCISGWLAGHQMPVSSSKAIWTTISPFASRVMGIVYLTEVAELVSWTIIGAWHGPVLGVRVLVSPHRGQNTKILLGICKSNRVSSLQKGMVAFSLYKRSCSYQFCVAKHPSSYLKQLEPALPLSFLNFYTFFFLISWAKWMAKEMFLAAVFNLSKKYLVKLFKVSLNRKENLFCPSWSSNSNPPA